MVSALGLAGKVSQQDKKKQHRGPQAGPAKEKKKQIDKKKRGVEGGKEKNPKVYIYMLSSWNVFPLAALRNGYQFTCIEKPSEILKGLGFRV